MITSTRAKELREEYKMYVSMWREARRVDGVNSRLARFFRRLADQVQFELKVYKSSSAAAA
jgi:hypothetical protein